MQKMNTNELIRLYQNDNFQTIPEMDYSPLDVHFASHCEDTETAKHLQGSVLQALPVTDFVTGSYTKPFPCQESVTGSYTKPFPVTLAIGSVTGNALSENIILGGLEVSGVAPLSLLGNYTHLPDKIHSDNLHASNRKGLTASQHPVSENRARSRRFGLKYYLDSIVEFKARSRACGNVLATREGQNIIEPLGSVSYNSETGRASYGGYVSCDDKCCPLCASRNAVQNANRFQALYSACSASHKVIMATFTIQHSIDESFSDVYNRFQASYEHFQDLSKREFRRFGVEYRVKVMEVTYGQHGWHIHAHVIWLCDLSVLSCLEVEGVPVWQDSMTDVFREKWTKAVNFVDSNSFVHPVHGFNLKFKTDESLEALKDYFQKNACNWSNSEQIALDKLLDSFSLETSGSVFKRGKKQSLSMFQVLELANQGNEHAKAVFLEYREGSKGKHFLRGLQEAMEAFSVAEDTAEDTAEVKTVLTFDQAAANVITSKQAHNALLCSIERCKGDKSLSLLALQNMTLSDVYFPPSENDEFFPDEFENENDLLLWALEADCESDSNRIIFNQFEYIDLGKHHINHWNASNAKRSLPDNSTREANALPVQLPLLPDSSKTFLNAF